MKKNLIIGSLLVLSFILFITSYIVIKLNNNSIIGHWKLVNYVNYDGTSLKYTNKEYSTEYLEFKKDSICIVKNYDNGKLLTRLKTYFKENKNSLLISNNINMKEAKKHNKNHEKNKLIIETIINSESKIIKVYEKVSSKNLPLREY
ncbi:MAG: hypothetical protein RR359_01265 [Bacilli bacterium]